MAEQALTTQTPQAEPVRVIVEQPQDISPEDRMWNATQPQQQERSRSPDGKFASTKPTEPVTEQPSAEQQPVQTEQPATQEAAEQPSEQQDAVLWDEVKEVKVKVPLKRGDQTWEEEVSLEQLRAGYLRENDYHAKTQELAVQRRQFEIQAQQAVANERGNYIKTLSALQRTVLNSVAPELQSMTPEKWSQLANDDPAAYVRLQNQAQQVKQTLGGISAQLQQQQHMQMQQDKHQQDMAVQEAVKTIPELIPEWNQDYYGALQKRGVNTYGFTQEEMANAYDPRLFLMLHDLEKLHKMMDQKPTIEKKVASVPPVLRPGSSQPKSNQGVERLKQARERVKTDTSHDAAADLFKAMGF